MPATGLNTPVVFLVFKRPELTAQVFARIREARPPRLFIVADGPRWDHPGEAEKCRQVRTLIEQGVDWPCEMVRDYAETNMGCARRVSSGITRVFEQVEEAIVLEDDCLPESTFFQFCAELLERYRSDERIAQIAGCSFRSVPPAGGESYFFSRYPHCWGWATWRRAWRHYDHAMKAWAVPEQQLKLLGGLEQPAERKYWRHAFSGVMSGKIDSWAYRWTLALWQQSCLSISPYRNLVANIGFDASATNTRDFNRLADLPVSAMPFPLVHPGSFTPDSEADERTSRRVFRRSSMIIRLQRRLRRLFAG